MESIEKYKRQLEEIQQEGALNVGFHTSIFDSGLLDWTWIAEKVLPAIAERGLLDGKIEPIVVQGAILDEYFADTNAPEFEPFAKYFFNEEN